MSTEEEYLEAADMIGITDEQVGFEPYLQHTRELRCLLVGSILSGIERISRSWKSNVSPHTISEVDVPGELAEMTESAATAMQADVIGIDWLQLNSGDWVAIEANLCPGLKLPWRDWRADVSEMILARVGSSV